MLPTDALAAGASPIDRMALYSSIPLDPLTKQTRFLKLLPGEDDSDIHGELFALSLHRELDFKALSYAWGPPGAGQAISVNSCHSPISDSLHLALRTIRRRFCSMSSVTLWIDAICINQEDNAEKNTQVPLMSDIYTGASSVIVWLGIASALDGLAMTVMEDLAARGGEAEAMAIGDPSVATMQALAGRIPKGNSVGDLLGGLAVVSARSWFQRTWILQEVSLPRAVPLVLCGDFSLCWECFCLGLRYLNWFFKSHFYNSDVMAAFPGRRAQLSELFAVTNRVDIQPIQRLRERMQAEAKEGDTISLETTMWETTHALATDPRDKVYGVLALAPKAVRDWIGVDYNSEVENVYADVVRYSFHNMDGLGILSCAGIPGGTYDTTWPSWLPRFDRPLRSPLRPINLTRSSLRRQSIYNASRDLPDNYDFPSRQRLALFGLPVDKVVHVDASFRSRDSGCVDVCACATVFSRAAKLCRECYSCLEAGTGRSGKGQGMETDGWELALGLCNELIYAPSIPLDFWRSAQTLIGRPIVVHRWPDPIPEGDSSVWIKEDGPGSTARPVESHRREGIPWEYSIRKPFYDVFWHAFIGDYLADNDGYITADRIPAPHHARSRVLEILQSGVGKNTPKFVQQLLQSEPPNKSGTGEHEGGSDERSAILKEKLIIGLAMARVSNGRCAFVTAGGWLGFGPPSMELGDIVVVFADADVPFIIRPDGETGEYLLIGEALCRWSDAR
ncbi:Heterokaryon incompatibility protein 6, OR allele [Madurella mycetomatis]|uniref:Heterokaryon incompatibility protein 6, OR allele n=1 Tax=Madurella mycetomatis TaxID=100816 RepID=A0A175W5P3_9PEZI|nr:Heterokaryon incompatibility protein 6, OR allele [Madurella mycetomatis]